MVIESKSPFQSWAASTIYGIGLVSEVPQGLLFVEVTGFIGRQNNEVIGESSTGSGIFSFLEVNIWADNGIIFNSTSYNAIFSPKSPANSTKHRSFSSNILSFIKMD